MLKRQHSVALGLILVGTLVVLNLPGEAAVRFKLALSSLFLPLFGLGTVTPHLLNQAADTLTPRRELVRQNEQLRRENARLQVLAQQAAETARENARLRQLLGWREQSPWKDRLRLARVLAHDPAQWWRSVEIDLGRREGLRPNLPVLTAAGLVGRVAGVGENRSQVLLVGDPNCKVSALVDNEARDTGVLGPAGPLESDLVVLRYLPRSAAVKPGQAVVTSGLGGVFPKGIHIGQIVDTRAVEHGLYLEARVRLAVNPGTLEEVWVLLP